MATGSDYRDYVSHCNRAALKRVLGSIRSAAVPVDWSHADWDPGVAFEHVVLRAFELEFSRLRMVHAAVAWPYPLSMGELTHTDSSMSAEQIDGAIHFDGLSCLVECKTGEEQDVLPLAKMRNQLLRRPAQAIGAVFSLQGFKPPARVLATLMFPQTVLLWDGDDVEWALDRSQFVEGMRRKYRYAVEKGLPDLRIAPRDGAGQ